MDLPITPDELSDRSRMRHNAQILAAYISYVLQCYGPRSLVVYTRYWSSLAGCVLSTILCSKLDLRPSRQLCGSRSKLVTANIGRQDLPRESGKAWTLQLPSASSSTETLLIVDVFTRVRALSRQVISVVFSKGLTRQRAISITFSQPLSWGCQH